MSEQQTSEKVFVPRGAIAFFAVTLVFFAAVWLAFYFLMIDRH